MAPKEASVYVRKGKSKSVSPSRHLLDQDNDTEYVQGTTRGPLLYPGTLGAGPSRLSHLVTSSRSPLPSLNRGPHSVKSRSPALSHTPTLVLAAVPLLFRCR
uniref:Putative ovule protein n=1 Tax=Solanum chacoense TaxID=4108 RepID=A0A0V0H8R9_SOLCH